MAMLEVLKGLNPGQLFVIEGIHTVLGRHPDCDIVLEVGAVSRQHAQITQVGESYVVEDLNSRNGTFVNGTLVQGQHALKENDRLKICDLLFTFKCGDPGDTPTSSGATLEITQMAEIIDDEAKAPNSTIMSTLDVSSSSSGTRLRVNPEVKLRAMIDITKSLSKALDLDEVLSKILDGLFKIFVQADRGFIALKQTVDGPLVPRAFKHRREAADDTIRISRTIVNKVMASKEAILSADAASDSRFEMSQSIADFRIRSMMCAPLIDSEGTALGVIQIDTLDQRQRFQQEDLDVLASVATQAAFAVENAQLHENALKQKAIEHDLKLARNVQQRLLPSTPPSIPGYLFFDFYEPANLVGGDYYDYIELPNRRLAVVQAHVSGKGIPAALLVAKLSTEIRHCLFSESVPSAAIHRLNLDFLRGGWEGRFVTLVLVVLDLDKHEATVVNAGHMAPLLRRANGSVHSIGVEEGGMPIGVDYDSAYGQFTCALAPGESLTLFTDGISEAMNADRELYGPERLNEQLARPVESISALGRGILGDVKRFVGKNPQADDMCLICFGRTE